jgi:myosin heavy subunit
MQFKKQLVDLMYRINAAQPHFVRCINPNAEKVPHV